MMKSNLNPLKPKIVTLYLLHKRISKNMKTEKLECNTSLHTSSLIYPRTHQQTITRNVVFFPELRNCVNFATPGKRSMYNMTVPLWN
mmetsp:Transcript_23648/g.26920  ORF Transcript_23648/g.26920 Transcript_23648/m.26920 type:complete len:87 (-) Transcript_23648:663-923(-)